MIVRCHQSSVVDSCFAVCSMLACRIKAIIQKTAACEAHRLQGAAAACKPVEAPMSRGPEPQLSSNVDAAVAVPQLQATPPTKVPQLQATSASQVPQLQTTPPFTKLSQFRQVSEVCSSRY